MPTQVSVNRTTDVTQNVIYNVYKKVPDLWSDYFLDSAITSAWKPLSHTVTGNVHSLSFWELCWKKKHKKPKRKAKQLICWNCLNWALVRDTNAGSISEFWDLIFFFQKSSGCLPNCTIFSLANFEMRNTELKLLSFAGQLIVLRH